MTKCGRISFSTDKGGARVIKDFIFRLTIGDCHLTRHLAAALAFTTAVLTAGAQGGPPMITDDPGTVEKGRWELNTALTTERRPGETISELPLLDLNYGVAARWQLKYEVAWERLRDGSGRHDGPGNSLAGVKWRFCDLGEKSWQAATYPQIEFNNPHSRATERGLAESGSCLILPVQVMRDFDGISLNADVGYLWHSAGGEEWYGGIVAGWKPRQGWEVAAELHWDSDARVHATGLTANFGTRIRLSEEFSLLLSVGRELHNGRVPRATMVAYLGMQTRL